MQADPFDALTDLFLGELSPNHAHAPREPSPVPSIARHSNGHAGGAPANPATAIEIILAGHLPVMPGAWVSQYARSTAERLLKPVALCRLTGGGLRIDLFDPVAATARVAVKHEDPASAMEVVRREAAAILVSADLSSLPIAGVPVARMTLLTSGDEAGVVNAYQRIKSMATCFNAGAAAPIVSVCVVGSPPAAATAAEQRLREAAGNFLGLTVEDGPILPRIDSARVATTLFEGPYGGSVASLLAGLPPARANGMAAAHKPTAPAMPPVPAITPAAPRGLNPVGSRETTPGPTPATGRSTASSLTATDPISKAEFVPEKLAGGVPALAACVPGLRPLGVVCPAAPGVQFAAGADAGLHLLVHATEESAGVEDLLVAAAWSRANMAILARACRDVATLGTQPTVLHLFTASPAGNRRLLDTDVRVHLLAPAEQVVREGWACLALN